MPSEALKDLGVWLDNTLSMSKHVTKLASSYYSSYTTFGVSGNIYPRAPAKLPSRLGCISTGLLQQPFFGHPAKLLSQLQRVQNSAARLIHQSTRYSPSSPLIKYLMFSKTPENTSFYQSFWYMIYPSFSTDKWTDFYVNTPICTAHLNIFEWNLRFTKILLLLLFIIIIY